LRELSLEELRRTARGELQKLGLEGPKMELYWICSVASEYNLDYETSFEKIVVPPWFPLRYDRRLLRYNLGVRVYPPRLRMLLGYGRYGRLRPGVRVYPPRLMREKEVRRESGLGAGVYISTRTLGTLTMLLPPGHELYSEIEALRGRPRKRSKPGRLPKYSDQMAVKCAVLKKSGSTDVEIARQLGLPVTKPYDTQQSDTARHLVNRGDKLINECTDLI
jgi:hypothetical protein